MSWHDGGRSYGYHSPRTLRGWIRENRASIDQAIDRKLRNAQPGRRNDEQRRLWVANFEPLYLAARAAGIKV